MIGTKKRKERNLGRWVIEGEYLRHNKAWSKDPDNLLCGWATKAPKNVWRSQKDLQNWHCNKCRKRAPKEIQFAADLGFVKEKPQGLTTHSTLGQILKKNYSSIFQLSKSTYPILNQLTTNSKLQPSGQGFYFPVKKK